MERTGVVDEHRFARRHIAQHLETQGLDGHGFGGDDVLGAAHLFVLADDERTNAEGIAKRQHAVACDHRHHCIGPAATLVHPGDRAKDCIWIKTMMLRGPLQFQRQYVQQNFTVRIGVDVPEIVLPQLAFQRLAVGQIAVVPERDAERRIHIERLRFEIRKRRTGSGIAAMTDADGAGQLAHVAGTEHALHQARSLVHVEDRPLAGHDAGGVLPAVLQQQQPVVQELIDGRMRDDADDSTHGMFKPSGQRARQADCDRRGKNQAVPTIRGATMASIPWQTRPISGQGTNSATNRVVAGWSVLPPA